MPVLVVIPALATMPGDEFVAPQPWMRVLGVVVSLTVIFRTRYPVVVLALTTLTYGAFLSAGTLSPGLALAMLVAGFSVANLGSRTRGLYALGATLAVVIATSWIATAVHEVDARAFQIAALAAFVFAAGDGSRSRRDFIAAITERAMKAEQARDALAKQKVSEERLRIARDLHDAVAHQIAVISLNAGVASSALDTQPEKTRQALATIRQASRTVLSEIGDLMAMLRSDSATEGDVNREALGWGRLAANSNGLDSGPSLAPQATLAEIDRVIEDFRALGMTITTETHGDLGSVPIAASTVSYRVIHEGLANAHKHGKGAKARVMVNVAGDRVNIVVTNPVAPEVDGSGSGAGQGAAGNDLPVSGFGLMGLRERVAAVSGDLTAGRAPGGFRLAASLPIYGSEAS